MTADRTSAPVGLHRPGDLLAVESLRVYFPVRGRGKTVKAVDDVSFSVTAGETFGLIGESGSGKSSIARAVMGLLRPTTGSVTLRGLRLDRLRGREQRRARRHYQMIFQDPHEALDPRMTVGDSVAEPLRIQRRRGQNGLADVAGALLGKAGLSAEYAQRRPHELSGGQKQRVNIARALALDPELLICDEAVSALDVSIQADILNLLADLQRELGLAYLFISHDIGVVSHIADRVGVLYLGVLVELGPAEGVIDRPLHPYTAALLAAEPQAVPARYRTQRPAPLEGELPSPIDPPSGCRFRTRCTYAEERCAAEVPPLRELVPDRWVACHFAERLDLRGRHQPTAVAGR